jgi:hypothetical protein
MAVDYGAIGGGVKGLTGGIADLFASGMYGQQANIYGQDVNLAKESTGLKEYAATGEALMGLGATRTGYGGGNLATSGSAVDVLAESAQNASLNKSMIAIQGQLEENDFLIKQQAAKSQETSSLIGGIGGLIGGAAQIGMGI